MVVDVWHAGAAGAAHRVELDPLFPSLRARESGLAVSPLRFRHAVTAAPTLFKRLKKTATLQAHRGCVNAIHFNQTGDLLVSGSDDRRVILWDWATGTVRLNYHSGHMGNIFQAKTMPRTGDKTIVTCAADGGVGYGLLSETGCATHVLPLRHNGRAHKLSIVPGSSTCFLSCGEDGLVNFFDLREPRPGKVAVWAPRRSPYHDRRLPQELFAIDHRPTDPNIFAVAGNSACVNVYDFRMLSPRTNRNAPEVKGVRPLIKYCYSEFDPDQSVHITGLCYGPDGTDLLASYSDGPVVRFDVTKDSVGWDVTTRNTLTIYTGHLNNRTVKSVNFLGPNGEHVISGSDCGHFFVWSTVHGDLEHVLKGDSEVVNMMMPHPYISVLATSGIDNDIKLWEPVDKKETTLAHAKKIIQRNLIYENDEEDDFDDEADFDESDEDAAPADEEPADEEAEDAEGDEGGARRRRRRQGGRQMDVGVRPLQLLQFLRLMLPLMRNANPGAVPDEVDANGLPVGFLEQFRDLTQAHGANFQGFDDGPDIEGVGSDDFDEDEDEDEDMEDDSEADSEDDEDDGSMEAAEDDDA